MSWAPLGIGNAALCSGVQSLWNQEFFPTPHGHHLGRGKGEQWLLSLALQIKNPRQSRLVLLTRTFFILNPAKEKKVFSPYWFIFQISFCFFWTSSCFPLKLVSSGVGA